MITKSKRNVGRPSIRFPDRHRKQIPNPTSSVQSVQMPTSAWGNFARLRKMVKSGQLGPYQILSIPSAADLLDGKPSSTNRG